MYIQLSVDMLTFTTPGDMGHYTFLYRINTSGVKNRLIKKVENVKN